ncbi:MAG TPA: bifunctional D-glycero-beta-D-manno-heptose-7-phosphate kinase/D-glycero-beta-D-manno-heptose 1-phosphate adenylyltransferase HldE [Gammaproteobacteria bacterium]|nr:bifunctional D-glycero-beta-D-manno-heptose-7-phosphate kinase/D-glycero-beta-D-manno-heptose 1-phosphate adenylyltransferase HldE [Gammaproteobacteria bacterium]
MLQLPHFEDIRVLVAGDVMLDRYWSGDTGRISPEAPVPVVRVHGQRECPGGAGNVALNIAALGADAVVLGVVGTDEAGDALEHSLAEVSGINAVLARDAQVATITKLRVLSRHQQLVRLDFEQPYTGAQHQLLEEPFQRHLAESDVVVFSDYGKGSLVHARELISAARAAGKPVLVDPKQVDFSHYHGASLVTPNLGEFEAAVGPCADEADLVAKGQALMAAHALDALLITRSEQGMTLLQPDADALHIPTVAREVFDVTGAGDTVIATLAAAVGAGLPLAEAAQLANVAAGVTVAKLGAATVTPPELRRALHQLQDTRRDVLSEAELLQVVADARAHGERIVMTNGCFDILHAGHVSYLEQAARLGERLIVAVNDDASVARLKGPQRPILPLAQRMAVLAGLGAVDWVVAFSEDTPERLICAVRPDCLVKGGDYAPEDIAGHQCAGEVRVLDFLPGQSSSEIIGRIRGLGDEG